MRTDSLGERRGSSTSGVDPTRSRSDAGSALTATGHGRQQDELVALPHLGLEPVLRANVLAAEVDVHERRELAVLEELPCERRVALDEVVDDLGDGPTVRLELAGAADLGAQGGRD